MRYTHEELLVMIGLAFTFHESGLSKDAASIAAIKVVEKLNTPEGKRMQRIVHEERESARARKRVTKRADELKTKRRHYTKG